MLGLPGGLEIDAVRASSHDGHLVTPAVLAMTVKTYLLSVPERLVRAVLGLGAGVAREATEIAIPEPVRRSQLYQNMVDTTLYFLIEKAGRRRPSGEC